MDVTFWILAVVILALVEFGTLALVSVWFVAGGLAALIAALFGAPFWLQMVLFVTVSGVCLLLCRPNVQKYIKPRTLKTNVDALIGTQALVEEPIDNLRAEGTVKLNGAVWSARSESGSPIPAGALVVVKRIEGVKAIVSPVNN